MYFWKTIFNIYLLLNKKDFSLQSFWHYIFSRGSELNNMLIWLFHIPDWERILWLYSENTHIFNKNRHQYEYKYIRTECLFEYKAALLASRCFGVLALAIFGDDDLTDSILDYFIVSYFEYLKYKEKQFFL